MLFLFAGITLVSFGLGVLRYDISDIAPPLAEYAGRNIEIAGVIVDEPDVRETHTKLTLKIEKVNETNISQSVKALLVAEQYPQFKYGDKVGVRGELQIPKNFSGSDSGRVFDYVSWLKKDGIYYQMFYPKIELVGHGNGNKIKSALFSIKHALTDSISRAIPEPHASLVGGIVFGAKHSLGEELLDAFRATGIIHIVVLSGYNVTIVAEWIGKVASFAPRYFALSLSSLGIVGFALMTGAGATIVRASIMALLVLFARATGRVYEITIALMIAATAMLIHNPHILIFDASFQLSFMATVGLIYLAPHLQKYFSFITERLGLRDVLTATIATQLFVLPLLLYMTGQLSIVSVPVNMLILAFIPFTMLFGFLTGVLGVISFLLSLPFAWVTYALLSYELTVVDIFNSLPFASVTIKNFPFAAALFLYALYGVTLFYFFGRVKMQK